jgi:hypothetical protein
MLSIQELTTKNCLDVLEKVELALEFHVESWLRSGVQSLVNQLQLSFTTANARRFTSEIIAKIYTVRERLFNNDHHIGRTGWQTNSVYCMSNTVPRRKGRKFRGPPACREQVKHCSSCEEDFALHDHICAVEPEPVSEFDHSAFQEVFNEVFADELGNMILGA